MPAYAKNLLPSSVVSRPLEGEAPTIDLAVGYSNANTSPILKLFLSRLRCRGADIGVICLRDARYDSLGSVDSERTMVKCARAGPAVGNRAAMEYTPRAARRIQMVLPRECLMAQPLIAAAMGVRRVISPAVFHSARVAGRGLIDEKSRIQVLDSTQRFCPCVRGKWRGTA